MCITFKEDFLNYQAVRKLKYQGILSKELVKHIEWKDDMKEEYFFSLLIHMEIITPIVSEPYGIEEYLYFLFYLLMTYSMKIKFFLNMDTFKENHC